MKMKTTKFEKYLGFAIMSFLINSIMKSLPVKAGNELMIYLMLASGLFAVIKIIRFYTEANNRINIIWLLSVTIIFAGAALLIAGQKLGLGIATIGTALFWLTYHSSFLANRSDIQ